MRWFETVAEAQRRARRRLPRSVYMALIAGSERGLTLHDNERAFAELGFAPHMAGLPAQRDLSDHGDGPGAVDAGDDLPDRRAGGPPRRRGRGRRAPPPPAGSRWASAGSRPSRSRRSSPRTRRRSFRCYWIGSREEILARIGRAKTAGAVGLDRHARLDVLARPRLGQPVHPLSRSTSRPLASSGSMSRCTPAGCGASPGPDGCPS